MSFFFFWILSSVCALLETVDGIFFDIVTRPSSLRVFLYGRNISVGLVIYRLVTKVKHTLILILAPVSEG